MDTTSVTFVDVSRPEPFSDTGENRKLTVQFWYPDVAKGTGAFPLVIFSHGSFGYRGSNLSTFEDLASNGYVVCSIDHSYHAFFAKHMLDTQFRLAQTEFASLRQLQQNAAAYRHDMRHHFALLQGLASKENFDEISEYLRIAQSDMDAITPIRFCENETVNLIMSAFAAKAKQSGIQMEVDATLPDSLPFSDTELCSLLSNALENAIQASGNIPDSDKRTIRLRMFSKNNKLCIDIRNSYHIEPIFHRGLPVSKEQGHGFGTKSMAQIVEKHGGVFRFSVKNGWFIFQATA